MNVELVNIIVGAVAAIAGWWMRNLVKPDKNPVDPTPTPQPTPDERDRPLLDMLRKLIEKMIDDKKPTE